MSSALGDCRRERHWRSRRRGASAKVTVHTVRRQVRVGRDDLRHRGPPRPGCRRPAGRPAAARWTSGRTGLAQSPRTTSPGCSACKRRQRVGADARLGVVQLPRRHRARPIQALPFAGAAWPSRCAALGHGPARPSAKAGRPASAPTLASPTGLTRGLRQGAVRPMRWVEAAAEQAVAVHSHRWLGASSAQSRGPQEVGVELALPA